MLFEQYTWNASLQASYLIGDTPPDALWSSIRAATSRTSPTPASTI